MFGRGWKSFHTYVDFLHTICGKSDANARASRVPTAPFAPPCRVHAQLFTNASRSIEAGRLGRFQSTANAVYFFARRSGCRGRKFLGLIVVIAKRSGPVLWFYWIAPVGGRATKSSRPLGGRLLRRAHSNAQTCQRSSFAVLWGTWNSTAPSTIMTAAPGSSA